MNVVGIDLGTTCSLVSTVREGTLVRFADENGEERLPSAVAGLPDGGVVVGRQAKNRRLIDPTNTVVSVKRSMGSEVTMLVAGRELTPAQVSALILGELLDRVERQTQQRPERAVITVPAYFNDRQRQATRDAGEIAGLTVERLVNEPTAAALAYEAGGEELVLIYDLGGGTFDVSVLERDADVLEVTASHGDTRLGGDDIDRALVQWVAKELGSDGDRILADPRAETRLVEAVERAKIALSSRHDVHLFDPFIVEGSRPVNLDLTLSRSTLSAQVQPFVSRTLACIDRALADAGVKASDLDRVILVGGSSRIPIVQEMVQHHLDMPVQLDDESADRAVVDGAGMLAGRAMGEPVTAVLVDITPHTLAAGVFDPHEGEMVAAPIIPRGTVVPVERTRTFVTSVDGQQAVEIPVAQGEHHDLFQNTVLGHVIVEDLPPSPAGSPVEVGFRLDLSGVLHVRATHLDSQRAAELRIANSPSRITERARRQAQGEVEALRAARRDPLENAATDADVALAKALVARAERALARDVSEVDAKPVRDAQSRLVAAIEQRQSGVAELADALSDALLDLM